MINIKLKGSSTKYLLRTLAKKYLPAELINQPKRGFEIPLKSWVDNELKTIIFDYLSNNNALYSKFIDKKFVSDVLNGKVKMSDEKRAKILWSILCMEIWYKKTYLNG